MNQMKKMVSHVFIKYKMFQNARSVVGLVAMNANLFCEALKTSIL